MDTEFYKILALALVCAAVGMIFSLLKNGLAFSVRIAGCILIFFTVLSVVKPLVDLVRGELVPKGAGEYISIMCKALGIAILTQITSSICRDCGESNLANGVELAGKIEIISLCIPFAVKLLEYISKISEFN